MRRSRQSIERGEAAPLDLATGSPPRVIWRLALPAIIGLSANALYHTVNAMFLGRLGAEAVSAVSAVFPVLILVGAVGEGIGVGTASYAARMLGARRLDDAHRATTTGFVLATVIGAVLSLSLVWNVHGLLRLFGTTDSAMPLAAAYLSVMLAGATLALLQILGDFLAIAEGNTRFSMWVLIGAFGINTALDPVLIFGFDLGVTGAAAATLIAQTTAVLAYAGYFIRGIGRLRVAPRFVGLGGAMLREMAAVGLPATLATSLTALAFALVYGTAGAHGDAAVAGIGITLRLYSLGALPVFGFCLGARSVLGFAWGAGDAARIREALRFMLAVTFAFCAAYALIVTAFAPAIFRLFTDDATVAAVGVRAAYACFVLFAFFGMHAVLVTFLQSTGKAVLAGIVLLAPQGYFLIPGLLILPLLWGVDGILASQTIAAGLTALLTAAILIWQMGGLRGPAPGALARPALAR